MFVRTVQPRFGNIEGRRPVHHRHLLRRRTGRTDHPLGQRRRPAGARRQHRLLEREARNDRVRASSTGVADANQSEVLRNVKLEEFLKGIALNLDFADQWGMTQNEAVIRLRGGLDLDLDQVTDQLTVGARLNDSQDTADFANAVATEIPNLIKRLDEKKKKEATDQFSRDAQPLADENLTAKEKLKESLAAKGVKLEPGPGVDLGDYLYIPEVLDAKLEWDSTSDALKAIYDSQSEYRNYWSKVVSPSFVMAKATAPPSFVGPNLQPFQARWSVYGMTAGLVVGSLLMLICWKLFP